MKIAGCFNDTKTSYMAKDRGKFDKFSYHSPFNYDLHPGDSNISKTKCKKGQTLQKKHHSDLLVMLNYDSGCSKSCCITHIV